MVKSSTAIELTYDFQNFHSSLNPLCLCQSRNPLMLDPMHLRSIRSTKMPHHHRHHHHHLNKSLPQVQLIKCPLWPPQGQVVWLNHQPRWICKQVYTIVNHDPLESLLFYSQLFIVCSNSNETHCAKLHNVFSISLCLVVLVVQVTCNFTSNLIMKDVHINS